MIYYTHQIVIYLLFALLVHCFLYFIFCFLQFSPLALLFPPLLVIHHETLVHALPIFYLLECQANSFLHPPLASPAVGIWFPVCLVCHLVLIKMDAGKIGLTFFLPEQRCNGMCSHNHRKQEPILDFLFLFMVGLKLNITWWCLLPSRCYLSAQFLYQGAVEYAPTAWDISLALL